MAVATVEWNAVAGVAGYNAKIGVAPGVPTQTTDVGNVTSAQLVFPTSGWRYVSIVGYDGSHVEGGGSQEILVEFFAPPTGILILVQTR